MNKLKYIRIREGISSNDIPIGADASNIDLSNGKNLQNTLGDYDYTTKGNIKNRIDNLDTTTNNLTAVVNTKANQTQLDNLTATVNTKASQTQLDNLTTQIQTSIQNLKSLVGSPLIATTAAQMTNTDKIYVYTGNETGYVNGNWYYYNGAKWVSGGVYNSIAIQTDDTLSIQGAAADAKKTGDELTNLKSAITHDLILITPDNILDGSKLTNGYMNLNGGTSGSDTLCYTNKIPVAANDVIRYYRLVSTTFENKEMRFITAFSGDTAVAASGVENQSSYTVPSGITHIVITIGQTAADRMITINKEVDEYSTYFAPYYRATNNFIVPAIDNTLLMAGYAADAKKVGDELADVRNDIEDITDDISTLPDLENAFKAETISETETTDYTTPYTKGYVNLSGVPQTVSESSELGYTNKISVQSGDVITVTRIVRGASAYMNMRFVTAYNGDSAVSAKGAENVSSYTVPGGIDGVQISASFYAAVGTDKTVHITRQGVQHTTYRLIDAPIGYFRAAGDLASGEKMLLPEQNIAIGEMIAFECDIGASLTGSVKVGRYFDNADISHITVDSTNVVVTDAYGTDYTYPHGLSVANNLQVRIIRYGSLTNKLNKLIVTSNGVDFSVTVNAYTWNGYKGQPFAQAVGQGLTNCVLSATSANIHKPIWIFGDSYIQFSNVRWPYYMHEDGYDKNVLFVGYPGETSAQNLVSLQSLIATGAYPQYLVWCMGMNDPDDETNNVVNANWKACYDYIVELCGKYPITPIFATIPCVPTVKHRLNVYKNEIVRDGWTQHQYRYIDFATAVGATEANSSWYSGMLDSDQTHPTAAGAKALYGRVLVDLPEVTVS